MDSKKGQKAKLRERYFIETGIYPLDNLNRYNYWLEDEVVNNINYTHSCKTLKDKETPTLKDAFIAGYKKRALMSGLKYDEVSELSAITNFKCWKSFDLNL